MKTWRFGENDNLVDLVLSGRKTATTYLFVDKPDKVGTKSILTYSNGDKACVTKTKQIFVKPFCQIDWSLAKLEGENDSLEQWRAVHRKFFKKIDKNFNENTLVVFEIFEVVKTF